MKSQLSSLKYEYSIIFPITKEISQHCTSKAQGNSARLELLWDYFQISNPNAKDPFSFLIQETVCNCRSNQVLVTTGKRATFLTRIIYIMVLEV